ncbi:hypothetical protein ACHAXS_002024, partial [Conticribra weissflogii]
MSPRFLTPPRAAYDDEAMMAFPPQRTPSALVGNQKPIIDRSSPTSVVSFNFDEGDAVGLGYHGGSLFQSTDRFEVNPPPLRETRYPSEGNPIVPGLGRHFLSAPGNSNQISGFVPNLSPTDSSEASANANALRTTRSSRSDSSPRTPRNSASRNSGGTPPVPEPASATPTPQNLADNPERLAKVKTELCAYYEKGKRCPWGDRCNYAHGEHELKFKYSTLILMEKAGQIANAKTHLSRPCFTWVSTGHCPFRRRCCAIHDPRVQGPEDCPSWLPAATSKTSAQIIMDPLFIHCENAIHQENPLIPQTIWEGCRPSVQNKSIYKYYGESKLSAAEEDYIMFMDTYRLVCNDGVRAFRNSENTRNPKTLTELQRLCCIVSMSRDVSQSEDSNHGDAKGMTRSYRNDYIFSPTHSMMNELCMILQLKYFLLLDVDYTEGKVGVDDVVREISEAEYKDRTRPWSSTDVPFSPSKVVKVHKLAFAPKGDHFANISFWFDEEIIPLEQSEVKRIRRAKQKIKTSIRNGHSRPHANGFLVSCTSSADFACNWSPAFDPFVPMVPAEDNSFVEFLVDAIMMHRVNDLICKNLPLALKRQREKELVRQMDDVMNKFLGYWDFFNHWVWPKRREMESVTALSMAPSKNSIHYEPSKTNKRALHMYQIWR